MKFSIFVTLFCVLQLQFNFLTAETQSQARSPYVELILCPAKENPWECAREQTSRLLNEWSSDLKIQWQDLKGAADKELNASLISRGFSSIENFKEKPSTIITKLEIGTNFLRKFAKQTADEFLGREDNSPGELNDQEQNGGQKKPDNYESLIDHNQFEIDDSDDDHDEKEGENKIKKHGLKKPLNYGRSNGVSRGKKKKKKALMKLVFLGTILKGKIELLLKILSAHLQVKFFAIALIGLVVNIARFWVDLRRGGGTPQKVIYYEHAHHQHHYEDQGAEDWPDQGSSPGSPGSGGYWKRSLPIGSYGNINNNNDVVANSAVSAVNSKSGSNVDLTYAAQNDPQYQAYRQQIPSYF